MSLEPTIRKSVEQGIFRFLANETLAKGVLELFERVRTLENGCPDAKQEDLGPGHIVATPAEWPFPHHIFRSPADLAQQVLDLETRNQDLMKRLDAALAAIQDVHSILGSEITNEGIRLAALRVKGERDEALQELANIDAVIGNRKALASCKSRAAKVEMMVLYCQKFAAMK